MNVSKLGPGFLHQKNENNTLKPATIGFAILIIFGIGGLVAAAVGVGGVLRIGLLSNLGLNISMITILSGVSMGLSFLIVGGVGFDKTRSHNKIDQSPPPTEEQID